jgi:hypothetical protein
MGIEPFSAARICVRPHGWFDVERHSDCFLTGAPRESGRGHEEEVAFNL